MTMTMVVMTVVVNYVFFLFNQRTSTNITGGAHIVTDLHRYFVDTDATAKAAEHGAERPDAGRVCQETEQFSGWSRKTRELA